MTPLVAHTPAARDALALPRDAWPDHPRFPSQALLLGGHAQFRRIGQVLIDRAEAGGDSAGILWIFRRWKAAMHSHERYEEHKLYPYLERRWGLDLSALRGEHSELREVEGAVRSHDADDGPASESLLAALIAHHEVLLPHLDREEELVLPALLALTPEEFDRYARSPIHRLLHELDRPSEAAPGQTRR